MCIYYVPTMLYKIMLYIFLFNNFNAINKNVVEFFLNVNRSIYYIIKTHIRTNYNLFKNLILKTTKYVIPLE